MWVPDIEQKVSDGREGLPVFEAFTHSAHTVCVPPPPGFPLSVLWLGYLKFSMAQWFRWKQ